MLKHHFKRIKQSNFILLDTMFAKGGGSGKYKRRGGPKGLGLEEPLLGDPRGCLPRDVSEAQTPEGSSIRGASSPLAKESGEPGAVLNAFPGARLTRKSNTPLAGRMIPPHTDRTPTRKG